MTLSDSRTLAIEKLVAEVAAIPLMDEAVFHSVRYIDKKVEKEVCDLLLLHRGEAILLSVKAQGKSRDLPAIKHWLEKQAPKALGQARGAFRTLRERPTWCEHSIWGRREFPAAAIAPRHGIALLESNFEMALGLEESIVPAPTKEPPASLMSLADFSHIIRYLRTWSDLLKYLNARRACLQSVDSTTLGVEGALLGYYTAMRDTFDGCQGVADAKIVSARGAHVRDGSAFRSREAGLSSILEDLMHGISAAGTMELPVELQHLQSRAGCSSEDRESVREHLCRLSIQERTALGEQIGTLCGRMAGDQTSRTLYAGVRFNRRPEEAYVVVVAREPDEAELGAQATDLAIAAAVFHERTIGITIVLNEIGDKTKFSIVRVENVVPSIEMISAGQEYFGHMRPRKMEVAR